MSNASGDGGELVLSKELIGQIRSVILSGPDLDKMNHVMTRSIAASLDSLEVSTDKAKLKLDEWLRRNVTIATTNSIWGPQKPYKDDSMADAFWFVTSAHLNKLASLNIGLGNLNLTSRPKFLAFFHQ